MRRSANTDDLEREQARHGTFFAREDVIFAIKQILDGERPLSRGWLPLLGGPGVGKTAILVNLIDKLNGAVVFHFIRRGVEGRDRPEVVERNLCAQIKELFPACVSADSSADVRLTDLLQKLSKSELGAGDKRLFIVIDGLDELALDNPNDNPLSRFLPEVVPNRVVILCATRPKHPHQHWLDQRDSVRRIDLDDQAWSWSNESACRAFWEGQNNEFSPPLERDFIEEAVERSAGNLLYAIRLRDWLINQPFDQRMTVNIPRGLDGFLEQIWADFLALEEARRDVVLEGLGVACACREALPASLFGTILGWSSKLDVETLLRVARPFLLEEDAPWHEPARGYRLYHESLREFIITKLGNQTMREHHAQISKTLATWPPREGNAPQRLYALRHAVTHRLEAGDVRAAQILCVDVAYLERKCSALGVPAVESDLEATTRALSGNAVFNLSAILAALSAEARNLKDDPTSLPTRLYNRLRCAGWSANQIMEVLHFPAKLPSMRLRHSVRMGATQLRSFLDHERPVVACVVKPDGRHLLSASADHTLRLWSLERGECVKVLRGHEDEVTSLAITSDGKTAISTSIDATVRLWNLESGICTRLLSHEKQLSTACSLIREDKLFVVGFEDGTLRAWNRSTLKLVETLYGHTAYVTACAVTPDGGRLVTASRDESVRVWDLTSFKCIHTLQSVDEASTHFPRESEGYRWFTTLAIAADGKSAFAASGEGLISQWNLVSGRLLKVFRVAEVRIDACVAIRDGHLLCGLADGTLLIWSLGAMESIDRLHAHTGAISACAVTLDGRRVVSASQDRSLKLWELSALGNVPQEAHTKMITACAMTPDESIAVSASEDQTLKVWDLVTGKRRVNLEGHEDRVTACAVSANGLRVASGSWDGNLRIWHVTSGVCLQSVRGHTARVTSCLILSNDMLITASHDRTIKIWKLTTLELLTTLGEHDDAVESCTVRHDGAYMLSVSREGTAKLWNLTTHACERTLHRPGSGILCGALTPDGRRAVLGREDGAIEVYDIASGQQLTALRGHEGRVFACTVSPDGARIIATFEDDTLRVFSLETYGLIAKLQGKGWFRCVATKKALICAGDENGNLWIIESDVQSPAPSKRPSRTREASQTLKSTRKSESNSSMAQIETSAMGSTAGGAPNVRLAGINFGPLRDVLANLYPSSGDAKMVVTDIDIDVRNINLEGSAAKIWQEMITGAIKQNRLYVLANQIEQKHPDHEDLAEALKALRQKR